MSVRVCLPIAIILAAVAGCTPSNRQKVYPVSGAIFLNGEPAVGARVFFSPAEDPANPRALRPFAIVENDGSFRLTTYTKYDGAPAGDYVVIVTWSIKSPAIRVTTTAPCRRTASRMSMATPERRSCARLSDPNRTSWSRFA
jgi:hypothetical protein